MAKEGMALMEEWKGELEEAWRRIPKHFRNPATVRSTLICRLYQLVEQTGCKAVAGYFPPLSRDRAVDVMGIGGEGAIVHAVCIEDLVSLAAVKSLTGFDSDTKMIFTTGVLEKKVKESRFFLKEGVEHLHLVPFEK